MRRERCTGAAVALSSTGPPSPSPRRRCAGCPRCCAAISASPAPRSAAMPATAAPAPSSSTAAPVCACLTPVAHAADRPIVTVEGLAEHSGGRSAPLQQAVPARGAAQCGICTPGMLLAATALLERGAATRASAGPGRPRRRALPLHRLSQDHHRRRRRAPLGGQPDRPPGGRQRRSARGVARVDGIAKLDGSERFGDDVAPADALWLSRHPLAARLRSLRHRRPRRRCSRVIPAWCGC